VHLAGERRHEIVLFDDAFSHQHLAEAAAVGALVDEGPVELLLGEDAARDEERAKLEAAGPALLGGRAGRLKLGAEFVGAEGLGHELGSAEAARPLERVEVVARREDDEGRRTEGGIVADELHELERIERLEVEVEDDDGWLRFAKQAHGAGVAETGDHGVARREVADELVAQV